MDEPPYDCQQCGACCVNRGGLVGYIWLTPPEEERMHRRGLPVIFDGVESFLGTVRHDGSGGNRVCVAFAGVVGGQCGCSIYRDRPGVCRQFAAGDILCQAARRDAGLPV